MGGHYTFFRLCTWAPTYIRRGAEHLGGVLTNTPMQPNYLFGNLGHHTLANHTPVLVKRIGSCVVTLTLSNTAEARI